MRIKAIFNTVSMKSFNLIAKSSKKKNLIIYWPKTPQTIVLGRILLKIYLHKNLNKIKTELKLKKSYCDCFTTSFVLKKENKIKP